MIVNWNNYEVNHSQVFHFQHSLRPFVEVIDTRGEGLFLDVNEMKVYTFEDLEKDELYFYRKDDDEDYLGVEVDGKVEWVS